MPSISVSEGDAYLVLYLRYCKLIVLYSIVLYDTRVKCGVKTQLIRPS